MGFTAYLLGLGFLRGVISQPLVVATAALGSEGRSVVSRYAVTLTLAGSAALAATMAAAGLAIGGAPGRGLLLFAPWIPGALLQDVWRSVLFRDSRGAAAAANDVTWLAVMAAALVGAWIVGADWAFVAAWGGGAVAGALMGFLQTRLGPLRLVQAVRFWRRELWPFGRWLFASGIAYSATSQAGVFLVGGILGAGALGGLRIVQTVFAPLTLLLPAIGLPALPTMSRKLADSFGRARIYAMQLSGLVIVLTTLYVLALGIRGSGLLGLVFGHSFTRYGSLIVPIAVQQVFAAAGAGPDLLLRAGKRGRTIFVVRAVTSLIGLALIVGAAASHDLVAVAWSMTAGTALLVAAVGVSGLKARGAASELQVADTGTGA